AATLTSGTPAVCNAFYVRAVMAVGRRMEAFMQGDTLHSDSQDRQSHTLIASDRVEGTPVRRANGEKIGTVQRLMIDKLSGNVAYAVLSFGGFLGMRQKHLPIPGGRLHYVRALGAYQLDLSDEGLSRAPSFASDTRFDRGDRSRVPATHSSYRA